jgi:hypothetical protein
MVFPTLWNSKVKWFRVHQTIWQEQNDRLQVDLSISRSFKNTPAGSKSGSPSLGLRCHEPRTARKEGLGISPFRRERDREKEGEFRCSRSFGLGFGALHKICLSITIVVSSSCSSATASVSVGQSTKGFFGQHLVSNISPKRGSWLFSSNLQLFGECHNTKGLSINSTWKIIIIIINKACLFLSTMRVYVKLSWAQRDAGWMITANACHTQSCTMLQ